jgi:hypothetical protein
MKFYALKVPGITISKLKKAVGKGAVFVPCIYDDNMIYDDDLKENGNNRRRGQGI